ncbi:hypothetical protein BFP70_07375 [Thioclava sp. SK-1]|uniref:hypothetical protein n=1 Tax=Thioclava sp. SK-1 TaxID=1889770 RepID=UPI0008249086|nr:hypothetical protein [Thioclava sp. SK-1]OCX65939.1 hypothetical protein BFP70_07375 [Thioclava sp. SK-1]
MFIDPMSSIELSMDAARVSFAAQGVIAMRLAGMAGLWHAAPDEMLRMVQEKQQAVMEMTEAATNAMLSGQSPDRIMQAGLAEVDRHTSGNLRRLTALGPNLGPVMMAPRD